MFKHKNNWNRYLGFQARPKRQEAGFTLVELLVVIAIIGTLIGLLLPAVFSSIETARRTACTNNMRQIALATNQYETQLRQYPLNWGKVSTVGTPDGTPASPVDPGSSVGVSWLAGLLPFIDLNPLNNQVALGQDPTLNNGVLQPLSYVGSSTSGINNLQVLATPVATFLCPSDTQHGTIAGQALSGAGAPYATTNYKACAGSNWVGYSGLSASSGTVGRNNGLTDGVDHGNGVICRGGATTAGGAPFITGNMDIRDGASKTILMGESVPAWCGWSLWFWFDGSTATCGIPLNYPYTASGTAPESMAGTWQLSCGFMSRHKLGANFAGCDGSVHYISNIIDPYVYKALATIDGNEATTLNGLPADWPIQ